MRYSFLMLLVVSSCWSPEVSDAVTDALPALATCLTPDASPPDVAPPPDLAPDLAPPDVSPEAPPPPELAWYVSAAGDDASDGRTPTTPWRTLAKVSAFAFPPGAHVYLRRGDRWRERLIASADGDHGAPITYGAYGEGARPRLVGSDVVTGWQGSAGAWVAALPAANCLLDASDHFVTTGWSYAGGTLTVNAPDVAGFSVCVREDVIHTNGRSWLVFRDLDVTDSALSQSGYGVRVQGGHDVTLENVSVWRAGKHHVGVINSDLFVGRNLEAFEAMPGQGYGGATAFVSYSGDATRADRSEWIDCTADSDGQSYPSFIVHGQGVASVLLRNLTSRGMGPTVFSENPATRTRIEGGSVTDGLVTIGGTGTVIDGLVISGAQAAIYVDGADATIVRVTSTGYDPSWQGGRPGPVVLKGHGHHVLDSHLTVAGNVASRGAAIAIQGATDVTIIGNTLAAVSPINAVIILGDVPAGLVAERNVWSAGIGVQIISSPNRAYSLTEWQAMGYERDTVQP